MKQIETSICVPATHVFDDPLLKLVCVGVSLFLRLLLLIMKTDFISSFQFRSIVYLVEPTSFFTGSVP